MEETRENRLAQLRAKKTEKENLEKRDNALGQELKTLENEEIIK